VKVISSQSWIMLRIAEKLDFVTRSTVGVRQMKMIDRQIRVLKTTLAEILRDKIKNLDFYLDFSR